MGSYELKVIWMLQRKRWVVTLKAWLIHANLHIKLCKTWTSNKVLAVPSFDLQPASTILRDQNYFLVKIQRQRNFASSGFNWPVTEATVLIRCTLRTPWHDRFQNESSSSRSAGVRLREIRKLLYSVNSSVVTALTTIIQHLKEVWNSPSLYAA